jgi:hypothetical protein
VIGFEINGNMNRFNSHYPNQHVYQQAPLQNNQKIDYKLHEWPHSILIDPLYEKFSPLIPIWTYHFSSKETNKVVTFALMKEILERFHNPNENLEGLDIFVAMRTIQPSLSTPLVNYFKKLKN